LPEALQIGSSCARTGRAQPVLNIFNIHVKLVGDLVHERSVLPDLSKLPLIGDVIEVRIDNRKIRARVSYAPAAGSRDGVPFHEIYADEIA
jgi:hypothetical protein